MLFDRWFKCSNVPFAFCRHDRASGKKTKQTKYGLTTGTGTLRKHLSDRHLDDWVPACDAQDIQITAKETKSTLEEYRLDQGVSTTTGLDSQSLRPEFSSCAFVEAIIKWIVADDQVCDVLVGPLAHLSY